MRKILLISRDPGGSNQLVALYDQLLADSKNPDNPEIIVIAKDYAKAIWQQNGITAQAWPDGITEADLAGFLAAYQADQIITGTGHMDDRTEQMVWRIARQLGIPTTAFLDSSHNIAVRFKDRQGKIFLPDFVSVIDDDAIPALLALGLVRQNIIVSGDLYANYVSKRRAGQNQSGLLHAEWGVKAGESLILFASDYIREMQALGMTFDVTEFDCLEHLMALLQSSDDLAHGLTNDLTGPYRLVIRPHPKDTPGKYDGYLKQSTPNMTIVISSSGASLDAVMASDMVASMGSSLLNEARLLGVAALELGPLLKAHKDG